MKVSAVRTTCHWVVPLPTEYASYASLGLLCVLATPPGHWGGRLSEQWNQEPRPNSMGLDERKGATEAKAKASTGGGAMMGRHKLGMFWDVCVAQMSKHA